MIEIEKQVTIFDFRLQISDFRFVRNMGFKSAIYNLKSKIDERPYNRCFTRNW